MDSRPRMFSNFFSQLLPADDLLISGRLFFVTGVMYGCESPLKAQGGAPIGVR